MELTSLGMNRVRLRREAGVLDEHEDALDAGYGTASEVKGSHGVKGDNEGEY